MARCKNFFALGLSLALRRSDGRHASSGSTTSSSSKPVLAEANKLAMKAGYAYCDATEAFQVTLRDPAREARARASTATSAATRALALGIVAAATTLELAGEDHFAVRLGMRLVRKLNNADASRIITARADQPFTSVDDLWRRAEVPVSSLVRLAEADAFLASLGLARREALWAIKALRDEPLPLFAAASNREAATVPEATEPAVISGR